MVENELIVGCVKVILEKYAEPVINKVSSFCKDEWEKFKVNFDISFRNYLENSVEKYGKIKTILYRTEPKYIYDFFICPDLRKGRDTVVDGSSIDNIIDISNFVIIQGAGGIGKSTFLKHLFLNEILQHDLIPVFVELKELNALDGDYDIIEFVFQRLNDLGSTIKKEYMDYALQSGCFLFLLDGYDEIFSDRKDVFFRKLERFCDKYSDNCFVISSRPYSEFVEFQRFTVLELLELSKQQALELVNKVEYDEEIRHRFLKALDESLYEKHMSFASNPLLLSIMLLTFDNYAEIPEKLHLFYANAFETLYYKHDATKAGYHREMKCPLTYDEFKKVFSQFCFYTYYQGKIELTQDDICTALQKSISDVPPFEPMDFLYDLVNSICVLYKDGLDYKFTHRSFQEYFTAVFLKEVSDQHMKKLGTSLAKKDLVRLSHDSVFPMLCDMAEYRFEQNILLPLVSEFEDMHCNKADKYDFYYDLLSPTIEFDYIEEVEGICLLLLREWYRGERSIFAKFLYDFVLYYRKKEQNDNVKEREAADKLFELLQEKEGYTIGLDMSIERKKEEMYSLLRQTWIGVRIDVLAGLRERLQEKSKEEELDIMSLLDD